MSTVISSLAVAGLPLVASIGVVASAVALGHLDFSTATNIAVGSVAVVQGAISLSIAAGALSIGSFAPLMRTSLIFVAVVGATLAGLSLYEVWAQVPSTDDIASVVSIYQQEAARLPLDQAPIRDGMIAASLFLLNFAIRFVPFGR